MVSCSALYDGLIKVHEKLRKEMKDSRVWVGAWFGERMPNVTKGRKSLSSDVHFGSFSTTASLPNLLFALYSSQIDRAIREQTDIHTHDLMKEYG